MQASMTAFQHELKRIAECTIENKNDIVSLKQQNQDLATQLNDLRQKDAKPSFKIFGFPHSKTGDDLLAVVLKIGQLLELHLTEKDFERRPFMIGHLLNKKNWTHLGTIPLISVH